MTRPISTDIIARDRSTATILKIAAEYEAMSSKITRLNNNVENAANRAAKANNDLAKAIDDAGRGAEQTNIRFRPFLDSILLLGPSIAKTAVPIVAATAGVGAGLVGVGAVAALTFSGISTSMDAATKGADTLAKAQDAVASAQRTSTTAANTLTRAQDSLGVAQIRYNIALENFNKSPTHLNMEKLRIAALNLASAHTGVTNATQHLTTAQGNLADATTALTDANITNSASMAALGRQYITTFAPLKTEFLTLKTIAATNVFPGIAAAVENVRKLFPLFQKDVARISTDLGSVVKNLSAGLVPGVRALNPLFLTFSGYLVTISAKFADWAQGGGFQRFVNYVQQNMPAVKELFKNLGDAAANVFKALQAAGVNLLPALTALSKVIAGLPVGVLQTMIITLEVGRLTAITQAIVKLSNAFKVLGIALAIPIAFINLIALALVALGVGLFLLWTRWDQIWGWIRKHPAYGIIIGIIAAIGAPFILVYVALVAFFKNWSSIWNGVRSFTLTTWDILKNAWQAFRNFIFSVGGQVLTWFQQLPGRILGFFAGSATWLVVHGQRILTGLWNGAIAVWNNVFGWFSRVVAAVKNFFSGAIGWLYQAGKDVIQGFWNGLKFVWDEVTGFIGGIVGWIVKHKGPISLDRQLLYPAGKALMEGLVTGLMHGFTNVVKFVGGIGGFVAGQLASVARGFAPGNKGAGSGAGAGGASGSLASWITSAELITGTPLSWGAAIQRRIMFESGGNPNAINLTDINAQQGHPSQGLMQTIPSTFFGFHQPGTSMSITDPVANIAAALNYIKSRYGTIFAIDPPVQGYKVGAWDVARDQLAYLHRGEMVVPPDTAGQVRQGGAVIELGPRSLAALASMVIELDGAQVSKAVTRRQDVLAIRGVRR